MLSKSLLLATATLLASANATLLWKPTTEAIAVDVSELVLNETLAVRADEVTYKGVGCDRIGLGQTDTNNARNAFISHCQGRTTSLYYYSGDTVAFYCQWHPGPQCDTGSANHAFDMITNQCGIDQVSGDGIGCYPDDIKICSNS